ncbi:MAG: hypothetical protein JW947_03960 [Sedimentisphaerales bacterium]|nr:hypothetical protein [Sedimentisphaerales bacterium]
MELSWTPVFKIGISLAGVLTVIGMFSELPWSVKLKITAVMLVGIILIGYFAWPLAAPVEPFGVVNVPALGGAIALIVLAVLTGLVGYFVSWPDGREIGVVAVPTGLAVWAVRCGSMADLMRSNPTLVQRQELLAAIKWEPFFWLIVVAAGFGGVLIGRLITSRHLPHQAFGVRKLLPGIIALIASVVIAQFCIEIFAQDVKTGSVVAQPSVGQIVFAVLVSFGIAAFAVKKFLNAGFIWTITASSLVTGFVVTTHIRPGVIQQFVEHYPPAFFSSAVISILPVQMVAFGVLGSIAGYWLAVRYDYWRKHL